MGSGTADPGGAAVAGLAGGTAAGVAGAAVGLAGCQAVQPAEIEATHRRIESGIASRVRVMPGPPLAAQSPGDGSRSDMTQVITRMGGGRCTFALAVRPEHMNPHGVVHGGVVYTLVDFAMGGALTSLLEPGERCATLEVCPDPAPALTRREEEPPARP
jgi:hypothetical protein